MTFDKPFFSDGGFYDDVKACLDWMAARGKMRFDGLIAQSNEPKYAGIKTMKIKPLDELTVDLTTVIDEKNQVRVYSYDKNGPVEENFAPPGEAPSLKSEMGRYTVKNLKLVKGAGNNFIAEYRFLQKEPYLRFKGFRPDKIAPNYHGVVIKTFKDYFIDPTSFDDLTDKTLVPWRKWASVVKRQQVADQIPVGSRVLDIGIGRGGGALYDLLNKCTTVYGIDPDEENLAALKTRFGGEDIKKLELAVIKGQNTSKIQDFIGTPVDVIVSFFSLSFFYKDEKTLDGFVATCSQCCANNGKVIVMFMDGAAVAEKLSDGKWQNNLVSIKGKDVAADKIGSGITIELLTEKIRYFASKMNGWLHMTF